MSKSKSIVAVNRTKLYRPPVTADFVSRGKLETRLEENLALPFPYRILWRTVLHCLVLLFGLWRKVMVKKIMLVLVLFAILGPVAAGTYIEEIIKNGATQLNGDQARAHLSDRTEKWVNGGAYYGPDGKMEAIWKHKYRSGSWTVSDDGKVCYTLTKWEKLCQFYMNIDGAITMIWKGQSTGVKEMMDGNRLSDL